MPPSISREGSQSHTLSSPVAAAQALSLTEGTQHASTAAAARLSLRAVPHDDPALVAAKLERSSLGALAGSREGTARHRARKTSGGISAENAPSARASADSSLHRRLLATAILQRASTATAGSVLPSPSRQRSSSSVPDRSNHSGSGFLASAHGRVTRVDASLAQVEMAHHLPLYSELLFFSGMNDLAQVQHLLNQVCTAYLVW